MTVTEVTQAAELLEALIRHATAEHASVQDRGFDSANRRAKLRGEIDTMYDKLDDLQFEARMVS